MIFELKDLQINIPSNKKQRHSVILPYQQVSLKRNIHTEYMQLVGCTYSTINRDITHSIEVIPVKIIQIEKAIEIHLVRPTEVCGKV